MDFEPSSAPIHVSVAVLGHREADDAYPTLVALEGRARVINCKDNMQWVLQRRRGEQWSAVAFCRTRDALIREARRRGYVYQPLLRLPAHHNALADITARCHVCGGIKSKPRPGLPRHFFCIAEHRHKPTASGEGQRHDAAANPTPHRPHHHAGNLARSHHEQPTSAGAQMKKWKQDYSEAVFDQAGGFDREATIEDREFVGNNRPNMTPPRIASGRHVT